MVKVERSDGVRSIGCWSVVRDRTRRSSGGRVVRFIKVWQSVFVRIRSIFSCFWGLFPGRAGRALSVMESDLHKLTKKTKET